MTVVPSIFGVAPQFVNTAGEPAVGDKLFFYVAGSNTKQNTYTDSTGMTANPNPIILDALGMPANEIWWSDGSLYKMVWAPSTDTDPPTSPIRTFDNLSGINDSAGGGSGSQSEWVIYPSAPTYISATSFSVTGDQTALFNQKRRVRTVNSGGTIYSTIVSAVFGAVTTITVVNDSGVLDAGLSQVSYGLLSAANPSMPKIYAEPGNNRDILSLGNNTSTIYTTAGTSTAYTITPDPAITAYAIGQSFMVNFNAASGASPTLQISGIATPPNLVRENPDGTYSNIAANDIPINYISRITLISTTQALVENMPKVLVLGTSVTTTSGTAIDFTSIPSWVKRITVLFNDCSLSGTDFIIVQIGDGSIATSGYLGSSSLLTTSSGFFSFTTGFGVFVNTAAARIAGTLTINQVSTGIWVSSHAMGLTAGGAASITGGGTKTLSGTLDRIRITSSGSNTFDSGSINICYE